MKPSSLVFFKASLVALACLGASTTLAASPADGSTSASPNAQQAPLSLKDAETIALRVVPGGRVISVERDMEWGRSVFEVEMLDADGWEIDLLIDATDGQVLRQQRDD
jgi:uncharacterized membrane protein YkoI